MFRYRYYSNIVDKGVIRHDRKISHDWNSVGIYIIIFQKIKLKILYEGKVICKQSKTSNIDVNLKASENCLWELEMHNTIQNDFNIKY